MRKLRSFTITAAALLSLAACSTPPSPSPAPITCGYGQRQIQKGTPQPICVTDYAVDLGDGACGLELPRLASGPAQANTGNLIVLIPGSVACAPPLPSYWMVRWLDGGFHVISDRMPNINGAGFEAASDDVRPPVQLLIVSADAVGSAELAQLRITKRAFTELPKGVAIVYARTLDAKG